MEVLSHYTPMTSMDVLHNPHDQTNNTNISMEVFKQTIQTFHGVPP